MTLEEENKRLKEALKKLKPLAESNVTIMVNLNIENDKPGKALRLYTAKGIAIGERVYKVNDSRNNTQGNIFKSSGYVTYLVELKLNKLIKEILKDAE